MALNRRDFLKTIGAIGLTVSAGSSFGSGKGEAGNVEFVGMLIDTTRCIGCQACEFACAEAHGFPEPTDVPEAGVIRKTDEKHNTVVNLYNTSKGEFYRKSQCMHCNEPACVSACLTKAMHKTKEGPVIWQGDKCMGCRYCMVSCPFDVPKFEYHSSNPKIQKCSMCFEKIKEGEVPACAANCPAEAIMFGTRRELIIEARKRIAENPGVYVDEIYGEHVAGGTGVMYLTAVPKEELGFKPKLQNESYPSLSKGFLFSVPSIFVLLPPFLLGIYEATKNNNQNQNHENEE